MRKFIAKASSVLICLLLAHPGVSGSLEKGAKQAAASESSQAKMTAHQVTEKLSAEYREWVEANLHGAANESQKLEQSIILLLNHDMFLSENHVRELARKSALARVGDEDNRPALSEVTKQEEAFQHGVSILNTKEALFRTINRSGAFSTKYRLLGDYIDLLRRELKMPRLKLASVASQDVRKSNVEGQ